MKFSNEPRSNISFYTNTFNPGPGHYDITSNPLMQDTYKVSFPLPKGETKKSANFQHYLKGPKISKASKTTTKSSNINPLIGPGSYYDSNELKKIKHIIDKRRDTSGLFLVTQNRTNNFVRNPSTEAQKMGPGIYNISDGLVKKKYQEWSFPQGERWKSINAETIPDINDFYVNAPLLLNKARSKKNIIRVVISPNFVNKIGKKESPGPGFYNPEFRALSQANKNSANFNSKTSRFANLVEDEKANYPCPGDYEIYGEIEKIAKNKKLQTEKSASHRVPNKIRLIGPRIPLPGPSDYNPINSAFSSINDTQSKGTSNGGFGTSSKRFQICLDQIDY